MEFHVVGEYYVDIDEQRQLRIAGPGNHLFLGFSVVTEVVDVSISEYTVDHGHVVVKLVFSADQVRISYPLVCNIRTLRTYTEGAQPRLTYQDLAQQEIDVLLPKEMEEYSKGSVQGLRFLRRFSEGDQERFYGASLEVAGDYTVALDSGDIVLSGSQPLELLIRTETNIPTESKFTAPIFRPESLVLTSLPDSIQQLYEEAGQHIAYLVTSRKTSSFEYGTIFPRDWIEAAQLGVGDLSTETIDFMYEQSLKHVDESGQGWHEDIIGEYRYLSQDAEHVDRKMIDIEPLYILGMERVSRQFLLQEDTARKLRAIGRYIVSQAESRDVITFKKRGAEDGEEYHEVGNWRDSLAAFPEQKPPIAPYDVNCIFYPEALSMILRFSDFFGFEETSHLQKLIAQWQQQKNRFLVFFASNLRGYSLALHGPDLAPLSVAHLDESYDLYYGHPSLEDTLSFADRILSEKYFYTPVGPILVAATTEALSEKHYHGKVIWPKQAAFAVAGLSRQYRIGLRAGWPRLVMDHLYDAITQTAEACFRGWEELGSVTELYYYDREEDRARFYLDQEGIEGQMSMIQLWSAAGCRRIIREYVRVRSLHSEHFTP